MKIITTIGSLSALLGCMTLTTTPGLAQDPAPQADTNVIQLLKTTQEVKVDGLLDEECWKQAVPIRADYIKGDNGKLSAEPRMLARYAWDDRYLYIAYEVFDSNLAAKGNGITKGPADSLREGCEISPPFDVAEFFVGFNNSNLFWEIHHNASNQFNDILVLVDLPAWKKEPPASVYNGIFWAKNEFIPDAGDQKVASAVQMKPRADSKPSTVNDSTDTDTGYTAELRLPWAGIGGWKKMAGRELTLLAVTETGELKDAPYHTSCATLPKADFFHNHYAKWPRYKLAIDTPAK